MTRRAALLVVLAVPAAAIAQAATPVAHSPLWRFVVLFVLLLAALYGIFRRPRRRASEPEPAAADAPDVLGYWVVSPDGLITSIGGDLASTGFRAGELAGTSIWPWAPPGSPAERAYHGALQGGTPSTFDNDFQSKAGHRVVWRIRVVPLSDGSARATGVDVTDLVVAAETATARDAVSAGRLERLMLHAGEQAEQAAEVGRAVAAGAPAAVRTSNGVV